MAVMCLSNHSLQRAWTDDTDHTLLMILSYLRTGSLSQDDFAGRLHTWLVSQLRMMIIGQPSNSRTGANKVFAVWTAFRWVSEVGHILLREYSFAKLSIN